MARLGRGRPVPVVISRAPLPGADANAVVSAPADAAATALVPAVGGAVQVTAVQALATADALVPASVGVVVSAVQATATADALAPTATGTSSGQAITVRSVSSANTGSAQQASLQVTKPAGTVSGDVLYAVLFDTSQSGAITPPSGWATVIAKFTSGGTNLGGMACYRKVAGGSEPSSYTWTASANTRLCVGIVCLVGVDTATPEDVTGTKTSGSANPGTAADAPSLTAAAATLLLTGHGGTVAATGTQATWTPPSGLTERVDQSTTNSAAARNATLEVATVALASGGATGTKTATASTSTSWAGLAVVVRAAVTGNATVTVPAEAGATAEALAPAVTGSAGAGQVLVPAPAAATADGLAPATGGGTTVAAPVADATADAPTPAVVPVTPVLVPASAAATAEGLVPTVTGTAAAPPQVWSGSAIDATGMQVAVFFEPQSAKWYAGCDVAGINAAIARGAVPDGLFNAFNLGSGVSGGEIDGPLQQGAAINGDAQKLIWLSGRGSSGGILRRTPTGQWTLVTTALFGDVRAVGGAGSPRATGHTRIALSADGETIWVSCQRASDSASGLARSTNGGTSFVEWLDFALNRHYTSLQASPQFAGVLYASADNTDTTGGSTSNPGVFVLKGATGASPTSTRIDTQAPLSGTVDGRQLRVVGELGTDVLYLVVGTEEASSAKQGVWRCQVGNPTAPGWSQTSVTWTKVSTGIDVAANWNAITASRNPADTATRLLIGCVNPTTSLGGSVPGSGTSFRASHYRSLDSGATWQAISGPSNVSTTVWGTGGPGQAPAEDWVLVNTGIASLSNNVLGGPGHLVHDLDLDDATDTVVSAGKSATWITQNPWTATAANVVWRPFVRQEGSVISRSVLVHPSDSLKVGAADVDRAFYTWTDGADAQPRCHLAQIVDAGVSPSAIYASFVRPSGKVLLGRETTMVLANTDPWAAGGGTWDKDSLASVTTGDVVGVCEFISDAADTVRLAASSGGEVAGQGGIFRKVNAGSWSAAPVQSFPGTTDHQNPVTFLAADGADVAFCLAPTAGLYRSANAGASWTLVWPKTVPAGNQRWYGRVARDPATPTTLYVSWGDAGLWQVIAADQGTLNADGTTATGAIIAAKLTAPGLLTATSRIGAVAVDATTGDLVCCRLANDPLGPGLLRSAAQGATFTDLADSVYRETGTLAMWVAKRGPRIYVSSDGCGMFRTNLAATATPVPTADATASALAPTVVVLAPGTVLVPDAAGAVADALAPTNLGAQVLSPTLTVEVAFDANPGDPLTVPTWTDLTARVRGMTIRRGRQYERAQTEAGVLEVELKNDDGALDPLNTASPYYPDVLPLRPIRVRATWQGATDDLYQGYVERWPQFWEGHGILGWSPLVAVDAFKVLANTRLRGAYDKEVLDDAPIAYYVLGEAEGATRFGSIAPTQQPLAVIVNSKHGAGTVTADEPSIVAGDPQTCVQFANATATVGSAIQLGQGGAGPFVVADVSFSVELWFKVAAPPAAGTRANLIQQRDANLGGFTEVDYFIELDDAGKLHTFLISGGAQVDTATSAAYADNLPHHVVLTQQQGGGSTTIKLYVDGAQVLTSSEAGGFALRTDGWVQVGGIVTNINWQNFVNGFVSHVAVYHTALSAAQVANHHAAGKTAFAGEASGARASRILRYASYVGATAIDAGLSTMAGAADLAGKTALEALQDVADAENGLVFVDGGGRIVLRSRSARYNTPVTATFGEQPTELAYHGDARVDFDDTHVRNRVTVTRPGGVTVTAEDPTSQARYFTKTLDEQPRIATDAEAQARANYLLGRYKDPHARLERISVRPARDPARLWPVVLGAAFGDRWTVHRRPPAPAGAITADVFVESVEHQVGVAPGDWTTTYQLSPAEVETYWVVGDPVLGVLGITSRPAY